MPVRPRHAARNRRGGSWGHWTVWIWFPLALVLVLAGVCLYRSGEWLVAEDSFGKVTWAATLAGESRDAERSDAVLKLYLEGRIDTTIISSVRMHKDRYEGELATGYLIREGYPREKLFEFRHDAYSTQEEAALLIRQFRFQGLDTVLIITSNFHTARTRRIFRKLSQGYPHILVHAAEYKNFEPSAWWSGRESAKFWLTEWMKTVSTFFELMNSPPETGKSETDGLLGGSRGLGGAYGMAEDSLPDPARFPEDSLARADSLRDSLAVPRDTGAILPEGSGPDSVRAGEAGAATGLQAADTAVSAAPSDKTQTAVEDGPAQSQGAAAAKPPAAAREGARKETRNAPKESAAAKPAASKPASKAGAKPAAKKPSPKPPAKDKANKTSR